MCKFAYYYRVLNFMLNSFLLLMPCFMSLVWAVISLSNHDHTTMRRYLVAILFFSAIYFYVDAHYVSPGVMGTSMVWMDIVAETVTLALMPTIFIYLRATMGLKTSAGLHVLLYSPALLIFGALTNIYFTMGVQNAVDYMAAFDALGARPVDQFPERIYYTHDVVTMIVYNSLTAAWALLVISLCVWMLIHNKFRFSDLFAFLKKPRASSPINFLCFILILFMLIVGARIAMGRLFLISHPALSAALSVTLGIFIFELGYVCFYFMGSKMKLEELASPQQRDEIIPDVFAAHKSERKEENLPLQAPDTISQLAQRFAEYIDNEQPYLSPGLTIDDVAAALSSNRTYVSQMMKQHYNTTLRVFLTEQRIEHAKAMLLENPAELLDNVALSSGFTGSSQMIKKFNEVVGMTPRAWIASKMR